jgi:hypothetical protein
MEVVPAVSVLVVLAGLSAALIAKLTGDQLLSAIGGKTSAVFVGAGLFGLVLVTHLFSPQAWTADVLKVLAGALLGAAEPKVDTAVSAGSTGVEAAGARFGDHAKVAGRDINETIENLRSDVANIKDAVINQYPALARAVEEVAGLDQRQDFLINTLFERGTDRLADAFDTVVRRWTSEGWQFRSMSSDYQGMDGVFVLFSRPSRGLNGGRVEAYHGSRMEPVDRTG